MLARSQSPIIAGWLRRFGDSASGARKIWLELNQQEIEVARCTVERLMRELGLCGARRGKKVRTTRPDPAAARPADLVRWQFSPPAPDRLWVADYTYSAHSAIMRSPAA